MEALVDRFELGVGDVSVDLGGGDVGVPKESLDAANVGAVLE